MRQMHKEITANVLQPQKTGKR